MTINYKLSSINSIKGFTLVELLIAIFIMTVIAGINIANFRATEKQKRVVIASDTVINAIRNAQNFTLAGKNTKNASPACRVPQYYYLSFNYSLTFAIVALNNNTSICGTTVDTIESYALPTNTRIRANGIKLNGVSATSNMSLFFTPPFASLTAGIDSGGIGTFTTATITVESTDGSVSKTVTVDGVAGRIGE